MKTKTSATWATATTVAPSQGTLSNVSAEESKPTQTVSYSNSDEIDPFQNTTLETKSAKKKPNLKSIICSYFFTVGYHLTLWTILAAIGFPFFLYFSDPSATGKPVYYGYGSLIGIYPKLNLMVPYELFDSKDNLIHLRFNRSTYDIFQKYYKNTESVIVYYKSKNGTDGRDCFNNYTLGNGNFCNAMLLNKTYNQYGECSEFISEKGTFYNFEKGNNGSIPCLMLKFNKILDYIPYRKFDQNCKNIPGCCDNSRVKIHCNSELVKVYPDRGVSICQWPFKGNNDPYHPPMAMLKIKEIPKHSTKIQCYAVLEEGTEWSDKEEFFTTGPHTLTFVIDP